MSLAAALFNPPVAHGWLGRVFAALWALVAVVTCLGAAQAQEVAIESVAASQRGSSVVLRVQLSAPVRNSPASFAVANPARIAFDLPGVVNGTGKNSIDVSQGDLRSVSLVTVGDRTRVVLNLKGSVPYSTSLDGNAIVVTLDGGGASNSAAVRFAEPVAAANRHSIRNIDFRRGRDGEGRVVVDLADTSTGVDIRQQGQQIVVEFLQTTMPDELRRRLDVTDFGTPVQFVNTTSQGNSVRMVIEPKGTWEHNAYQSDTQFVVEVKPVREDPNRGTLATSRPQYQGDKLSLNFQNIEVRSVLQVIADFTNINIITSESVNGNLTLRLRDVPWDQALDIVMQAKGLDMRRSGNVIWVAPREELAAKEKLELEAKQAVAELEALRTESFQLNYHKAADVVKIIAPPVTTSSSSTVAQHRLLSKRGSAAADPLTNQIFVQDIPSRLDEVRRLVRQIDIPTRQVLIEARIVEATDGFSQNLGVRLSGSSGVPTKINGTGVYGSVTGSSASTTSVTVGDTTLSGGDFVSLPAANLNGYSAGALGITLFNSSLSKFISLELSALESDGKGRIISSPRVITANQVEATIEDGEEIPYQQSTSSGATSISFRKAVLSLKVTPQITPEGSVILNVNVNKDSRGTDTTSGPAINTKNVKTQVLVDNGGTVVIGGIYRMQEQNTVTKIPLLGDIPFLGALFRNKSQVNSKSELLIFLTPRIISNSLANATR
ncbi:type IV pilus secretin PilQ [Derxia gummosa]|uniref:Type IV pilus biogenesis and competence protein PilQ n=1 Tax=Derxia gummosa DSM 723 TaxID=1121388 RepID=A0A8B6X9I8_9BURK|nr:type IV pilus secretin PilQ [Derxia gummosa]